MSQRKTALVLPGGGARGAFQVGVLKAIAEIMPPRSRNPFGILSGTSAGAINSAVLASRSHRFRFAVTDLERVWGNFRTEMVYRADTLTMVKSSLHWLAALVFGGLGVHNPRSLLDNAPLRALLSRNIRFPRIQASIERGDLDAVAITAAGYRSARSVTFFQARGTARTWSRTRRVGIEESLNLDHLMASIAVPMIFEPVRIRGEFFGDGAMRQATPLSPAVHLGADRILVIGVRNESAGPAGDPAAPQPYPSFGQIAGYVLDTLFLDGLIPTSKEMPRTVRLLLRGLGGRESRLISFLLFESGYTRALIDLGYRDAMRMRDELASFVSGAPVPSLYAPSWIRRDLTGSYPVLQEDKGAEAQEHAVSDHVG